MLASLSRSLPRFARVIQLVTLLVTVALVAGLGLWTTDALLAQNMIGWSGATVIIFAQLLRFLPHFPEASRPRMLLVTVLGLAVFLFVLLLGFWYYGTHEPAA